MDYPHCLACDKIFRSRNSLKAHQNTMHSTSKPSVSRMCNICKKSFKNITGYKNHLKKHKNSIRCNLCDYATTRKADLRSHSHAHQLGKTFCCQCNMFVAPEHEHCHKHDETHEIEEKVNETGPEAKGSLELTVPFNILEACHQLCPGQLLQMSGTSANMTKSGLGHHEEISLRALKKDAYLTMILQANTMGSVFQQKLSQIWHCEITSSKIITDRGDLHEDNTDVSNILADETSPLENEPGTVLVTKAQDAQECCTDDLLTDDAREQLESRVLQGMQQVNTANKTCSPADTLSENIRRSMELNTAGNEDMTDGDHESVQHLCSEENGNMVLGQSFQVNDNEVASDGVNGERMNGDGSAEGNFVQQNGNTNCEKDIAEVSYNNDDPDCEEDSREGCGIEDVSSSSGLNSSDNVDSTDQDSQCQERGWQNASLRPRKQKASSAEWNDPKSQSDHNISDSAVKHESQPDSETGRMRRHAALEKKEEQLTAGGCLKLEKAETLSDAEQEWLVDDLQGYMTMVKADRKMKDEVQELNALIIGEMMAAGEDGTEKLIEKSIIEDFICILCMKTFRKHRWYFFCRHLKEIHYVTALDYRNLLLLDSNAERLEKIKYYKEQQLEMVKRYKEEKYKVKENQLIQCPGCMTVLSTFSALCAHIRSIHLHDSSYPDLVSYVEELREKRMSMSERRATRLAVKVVCDYCGAQKIGMNGIKVHLHMAHPNEPDLKEKLKKCRDFVRETNLKLRREQYHNDVKNKQKGVLCRFCGEKYSFRSSRGRHEKYSCEYNPNRIKTFTCQYCDHRFLSKEDLAVHRKQHVEDDFKFVCDICGVVRRTKAGMYDHKKNKHGTKPPKHKCPYCKKMFHNKDRMKTHMTVHSDVRPFQCEICGHSFKTRASVVKHQNAMHYNKYTYYCKKCGHGVSKLAYLQSHKCGRIRRSQGARDVSKSSESTATTSDAAPVLQTQTIVLPELTTLPKMETHHLVYDDQLNKDAIGQETELAPHILMGANLQVNGNAIQTVSMPYTIDANQQLVDVLPQHAVSSGFTQDFGLSQVTVIDYTNAAQLVDSRPVKLQYSNTITDQNAL